jgi:hypothetical protein
VALRANLDNPQIRRLYFWLGRAWKCNAENNYKQAQSAITAKKAALLAVPLSIKAFLANSRDSWGVSRTSL